jgi:hypothetical protein
MKCSGEVDGKNIRSSSVSESFDFYISITITKFCYLMLMVVSRLIIYTCIP